MNMAHMYNVLTSDLMMENAAGASSALGEGRLRRGQFKGQTEVDLANLKAFQLEQISQKKVNVILANYSFWYSLKIPGYYNVQMYILPV